MTIPVMKFTLQHELIMTEPMMQFTVLSMTTKNLTWTSQEGSHTFQVG